MPRRRDPAGSAPSRRSGARRRRGRPSSRRPGRGRRKGSSGCRARSSCPAGSGRAAWPPRRRPGRRRSSSRRARPGPGPPGTARRRRSRRSRRSRRPPRRPAGRRGHRRRARRSRPRHGRAGARACRRRARRPRRRFSTSGASRWIGQRSWASSIQARGRSSACASMPWSFQWAVCSPGAVSKVTWGRGPSPMAWGRYSLAFSSHPEHQTRSKRSPSARRWSAAAAERKCRMPSTVHHAPAGACAGRNPQSEMTPSMSTSRSGLSRICMVSVKKHEERVTLPSVLARVCCAGQPLKPQRVADDLTTSTARGVCRRRPTTPSS